MRVVLEPLADCPRLVESYLPLLPPPNQALLRLHHDIYDVSVLCK